MFHSSLDEWPLVSPTQGVQILLLGQPLVRHDGQPVIIPRVQSRSLLYCLGSQQQPVSRDELNLLLWPDIPDKVARRHLTQQIALLRSALSCPDLVLTTWDDVTLNYALVWSDVVAIKQIWGGALHNLPMASLRRSIAVYRGSFLAGIRSTKSAEYDVWASAERRTLERLYLRVLATLIEVSRQQGEFQEAIALAQRYLELDNLAEGIHRQLIRIFVTIGDRAAALRQYEYCIAVLKRELGAGPMLETRQLYQAVKQDRSTLSL
jgi:DNA-binding SARP family transcriptional activator